MRARRFKVDDLTGLVVRVGGGEARHGLRVLRVKLGAELVLFDGRGHEVTGRVCSVGRDDFEVEVTQRRDTDPDRLSRLDLAVAAPKGNRGDWLVEKSAELGVSTLWLLRCERGEVLPGTGKLARWRRKAVEAAKQAGRVVTMVIEPPRSIAEVLAVSPGARVFYGHPSRSGLVLGAALHGAPVAQANGAEVLIFIGPEGGFSGAECSEIERAGGRAVRLSNAVLRVETAAVAAASIWGAWVAGTAEA
ncbi:MAG: 16S rRNA (uracil(1498)-N(3))-methyltransferase [Phycisphaerae bacterium]|nr:16S rRNA (uracil(1498)-N(3))-methyltransferase [Phycisphaerae bacterium]